MPPKKNEQPNQSSNPETPVQPQDDNAAELDALKKQDETIQKLSEENNFLRQQLEEASKAASSFAKAVSPGKDEGEMIGNKDEEGKFPFPANWKNQVVVHQCQVQALGG